MYIELLNATKSWEGKGEAVAQVFDQDSTDKDLPIETLAITFQEYEDETNILTCTKDGQPFEMPPEWELDVMAAIEDLPFAEEYTRDMYLSDMQE
jgi:hypothetical protein